MNSQNLFFLIFFLSFFLFPRRQRFVFVGLDIQWRYFLKKNFFLQKFCFYYSLFLKYRLLMILGIFLTIFICSWVLSLNNINYKRINIGNIKHRHKSMLPYCFSISSFILSSTFFIFLFPFFSLHFFFRFFPF